MGVKLHNIITRDKIDYQELAGKIIAIDAPNIIMSLFNFTFKNSSRINQGLILDRTQRPISHLYGLLYRINFFYSKKIFPLFCFDGKPSELKRMITKDQLKDFIFTQRWYAQAVQSGDKKEARNIALSKEYLWQNILKESKQLLGALGVPFIEAPSSAESQCAYLVKKKIATFSNSQDFDSLLFGAPRIIQNISKSLRRKVQGKWQYKKVTPLFINLKKNLRILGINQFQLVDMALMLQTDYFPGITGIGPKKALHLVKTHKNIETIIREEKKRYDFTPLTSELIYKIRKLFLLPTVLQEFDTFYWNSPNNPSILSLLCREHHLNRERVKNNLGKLHESFKKCRSYFSSQSSVPKRVQTRLDAVSFGS
ncbi:MAG: hypothetical protein ACXAAI_10405 [Promethearchaeota archaeon]|jgi:flap endonuclease-1